MDESILNSVKKILGLEADYTAFDTDILIHINSALATLNQLGIGPVEGFEIGDAAPTWEAFVGIDPRYNSIKTYVYLRVRTWFDPPATSFHLTAINEQLRELEWRLSVYRESTGWTDPDPEILPDEELVDGGSP
jgi:hypothetical protein